MKEQEKNKTREGSAAGKITAKVIDEFEGLKTYEKVFAVRIRSKDYVLLIMEDYTPAIGHVNGEVVLLTPEGEVPCRGVDGFFRHQNNAFTLVIRSYTEEEG